jgi:hypothetical protein
MSTKDKLEFAVSYICSDLITAAEEIGRMLGGMIENHTRFCPDATPTH